MKFEYLARSSTGEVQAGTIDAPNESAALKTLQDYKLIVIRLKAGHKTSLFAKRIKIFEFIKRKEIFIFFRQLSILVGADVPLVQSLRTLSKQANGVRLKEIILEAAEDVDGGSSFSKALSKYPKAFSPFVVSLIKTGEVSGRLQESLNYLADYLEKQYYLISKIKSSMTYPGFIFVVFIVIAILIIVMVMPSLTSILVESGQELPLSTRVLMGLSNLLLKWGWVLIILLIGALFGLFRYSKSASGKPMIDKIVLKIPVFGKLLRNIYLSRLAETISVLIKGGVSVLQSLTIASEVVGNSVFEQIMLRARDEVRTGRNISAVLEEYKEFPPMFYQMVFTGEKTGKLDSILDKLAQFYKKEIENVVDNLSQLIEPVLIVMIAIGVAVLVFSVFMPIYGMVGAF